jgi:uncharacterized protein (TIGR02246 family)
MRHALTLCAVAVCGTVALARTGTEPRTQSSPSTDAAIKQVADAYVKATLAGDAKGIAALYTDDAVEMPPNQPMIKGKPAIEQYYQQQLAGGVKFTSFSLNHIESRAMGDTGYDVGTYDQSLTPPGGQATTDTGKYAVILKRVGGAWKVAYAIYSSDKMPTMK